MLDKLWNTYYNWISGKTAEITKSATVFFRNLFEGKSISEQMSILILFGFFLLLAEIILSKLIKWIRRKLK